MRTRLTVSVLVFIVGTTLLGFGLTQPDQTHSKFYVVASHPAYRYAVNGVLGDESFIETFGRKPNRSDSEDLRLRTHLSYVEDLLRSRPVGHLTPSLQEARLKNIERLHEYWTTGVFPRNTVVPDRRNPIFIDEAGRICAVGYLFEQDMGRKEAEEINAEYKTATIFEISSPVLAEWLETSGLTIDEAAMIQPGYGPYYTATYAFSTDGDTECGVIENPDADIQVDFPWPTLEAMPATRMSMLSCADRYDDWFGASGFSDTFDPDRAIVFSVSDPNIVFVWEVSLRVFTRNQGPTEARILLSSDGQNFIEVGRFSVSSQVSSHSYSHFTEGETVYVAIEARGGDSSVGELYVDDVILGGQVFLPVELISFNAQVSVEDVSLHWVTSSETNNAGFEVQMRTDGEPEFETLGFVEGHSTTTEVQNYSFTAENLAVGTYAFRLKQIDYDGAFEYSDEIEATIAVPGTHLLTSVYPNPFNPEARFSLSVAQEQRVNVTVYDVLGRKVLDLFDGLLEAGRAHPFALNGQSLATGLLFIRATGETFTASQTVTLVR